MRLATLARLLTISGIALAAAGGLAGAASLHTVLQQDKSFSEKKIEIAVGDSISFKNADSVRHNIMIRGMDSHSGIQEPGSEWSATFDKAGKYKVRCGIHPKMKLKVVVN